MNEKDNANLLGFVKTDVANGIGTITFGHPSHNSLPSHLLRALKDAIKSFGTSNDVKVILLKSEGERTFCAGASFDELATISDFETGKQFFLGFSNVINAMRKCPKLIIGRVQGRAIGGGVGLAAATDYCMATPFATIKLSELFIGLAPFVIGAAVQRKVGVSAFSELAINATEWRTAHWAKEKGLFNEVFDSIEQLDAYTEHLATNLAKYNPESMQLLKKMLWEGTDNWDELLDKRAALSGNLVLSDFTKNALAEFKQKK